MEFTILDSLLQVNFLIFYLGYDCTKEFCVLQTWKLKIPMFSLSKLNGQLIIVRLVSISVVVALCLKIHVIFYQLIIGCMILLCCNIQVLLNSSTNGKYLIHAFYVTYI